jgi:ribosomal protein S18 acetylase RimI-like enzyme
VDSRSIEELTLNAWPPLETLLFDGWILSFSEGYTRRANSIHPLYPSTLSLPDKISSCEVVYADHGRETTFKLTDSPSDADIDLALERRGYAKGGLTSVQIANLGASAAGASADAPASVEVNGAVALETTLSARWFADFNRLTATPESLQASERRLLEKISPPHAFGSVARDGETVAVGLAVAERGYVGLFDIVVDNKVRNRGIGRRLCFRLLEWAATTQYATTAYLAVLADNAPAQKLYANLGFREAYTYWYRHAPAN